SFRQSGTRPSGGRAFRGFHLDAFVVRTRLFKELLEAVAPAVNDPIACAFAFGCLLRRREWEVGTASDSVIDASLAPEFTDGSDSERGACLAAIERRVLGHTSLSKTAILREAFLGQSSLAESWGAIRSQSTLPAIRRLIDPECVSHVSELARLFRQNDSPGQDYRRAA
ncbi:MAG: hypothetical protein AAGJ83_15650, partial [Planctomycetota bacterium]